MAEYDIQDVINAARQQKIVYPGRKVQRDIRNLGYELKDLSDCLSRLRESDFRKTHCYLDSLPVDDYVVSYQKRSTADEECPVDDLYIKFCMIDGNLVIELVSFHLTQ